MLEELRGCVYCRLYSIVDERKYDAKRAPDAESGARRGAVLRGARLSGAHARGVVRRGGVRRHLPHVVCGAGRGGVCACVCACVRVGVWVGVWVGRGWQPTRSRLHCARGVHCAFSIRASCAALVIGLGLGLG